MSDFAFGKITLFKGWKFSFGKFPTFLIYLKNVNISNMLYWILFLISIILIWIFWKWRNRVILITHSGAYHLDEVFSTAVILKKIKKEGKFFQVIRTRDEKIFQKWRDKREKGKEVYIYDVGRIYDEDKNEFDHHQKGGAGKRENGIKFSSAGLVWKKFGEEISGSKEIALRIEKKIVLAIDALDNGQEIYEKKYDFAEYGLINLIKTFLPLKNKNKWKVKFAFCKSVKLISYILDKEITLAKKNIEDEKKVAEVYENSENKKYLIFYDNNISLSSIPEKYPEVLFTITKKEDNVWIIETVPETPGSFKRRKYLPESWAALEGSELDKVTGVSGGIFCHKDVFIASAKTEEAAIEMVKIALKNNN